MFGKGDDVPGSRHLIWLLFIASIPAVIAGLAFGNFFEDRFDDPFTTCFELLGTAGILLLAEYVIRKGEGHEPVDTPGAPVPSALRRRSPSFPGSRGRVRRSRPDS